MLADKSHQQKKENLTVMTKWNTEVYVDDWTKNNLTALGLKSGVDFTSQSDMSPFLKQALEGGSKTKKKTGGGIPDLQMEKYKVLVIFEHKLSLKKLVSKHSNEIKLDDKSVGDYAVNGAIHYAQAAIASEKYHEVVAIGIAGDDDNNVELEVYYVHSQGLQPKFLKDVKSLDFLETEETFNEVLHKAKLTNAERHRILIDSRVALNKQAKALNRLMNNHSINVEQRVIYVSGCLLALQAGLVYEDLKGKKSDTERDGRKIVENIKQFFEEQNVPARRMELLLSIFSNAISTDTDRDELMDIDKAMGALLNGKASLNTQVFAFIQENIYKAIDATNGHLDIMGEMYSEFLKFACGDGKDIGIVLTPPYVTKMMVEILNINENSKVMDLATGSAGFLISAMAQMVYKVEEKYGKGTTIAKKKISEIKENQLLGVELDAKMFALATTNMLLRGDASTTIEKGSSFERPESLYKEFAADRLLLNPPFSYKGNGMPFIEFGLNHMEKGGLGAIIVQDSAGSGKAVEINKRILKSHTLKASFKMPNDLFQPNAGVQTSIYVFEVGKPHDFDETVKFIDFRNDGYKRTGRGIQEIDHPSERYDDIIKIYKGGTSANLPDAHKALWDLKEIFIEDQITNSGADWNFEQHQIINTRPEEQDFRNAVGNHLAWEISQLFIDTKE